LGLDIRENPSPVGGFHHCQQVVSLKKVQTTLYVVISPLTMYMPPYILPMHKTYSWHLHPTWREKNPYRIYIC